MVWTAPTESDFNGWLRYDDVLDVAGHRIEDGIAERAFLEELRGGQIIAVARNSAIGSKTARFDLVNPGIWQSVSESEAYHFWNTGQLIVFIGDSGGYGGGVTHRYFDVRFDPASLDGKTQIPVGIKAGEEAPPTAQRRQDLPLLPEPIARAWVDWFKTQAGASKDAAEKAALHMFPNHNLSRDRIRDLMGPSGMGRPPKHGN